MSSLFCSPPTSCFLPLPICLLVPPAMPAVAAAAVVTAVTTTATTVTTAVATTAAAEAGSGDSFDIGSSDDVGSDVTNGRF